MMSTLVTSKNIRLEKKIPMLQLHEIGSSKRSLPLPHWGQGNRQFYIWGEVKACAHTSNASQTKMTLHII